MTCACQLECRYHGVVLPILILLVAFGFNFSLSAEELSTPFWDKDTKSIEAVQKDRKILVSVKSVPDGKQNIMRMQGLGRANVPFKYSKNWTADFGQLERVSDFVKEVKWNQKKKELFFHTVAFDYHAKMTLRVDEKNEEKSRSFPFKVISGVFTGMYGELKVEDVGFLESQISIRADYKYTEWAIPKVFLEFGLEFVLQKFAERLRSLVEEDFKKGKVPEDESKDVEKL